MSEHPPYGPEAVSPVRSRSHLAIILVIVGLVILLSRINVLGAIVWSALLPIGMVAFGLELLTESRYRRQIVSGALLAALVIAPLVGIGRMFDREDGAAQIERSGRANNLGSVSGVDAVRATIGLTTGSLSIRSLPERSEAIVATNSGEDRDQDVSRDGSTAVVKIDQPINEGDLDLRFTRAAPLDLSLQIGAGDIGPLDLEDLQIRTLNVRQTAGDASIALPDHGVMEITISSDFGDVEVDLPDDLAARIEASATVGDVEIDDRFEQRDGAYVSENYSDSAPNRATIKITKTAGNITIR